MNKRSTIRNKKYKSIMCDIIDLYKQTQTIYIVYYKEIHHVFSSKFTRNNTYNLCSFEDLDIAKEYMDLVYKNIVDPYIENQTFKIISESNTDEVSSLPHGNKIMYQKYIKLVGNTDSNTSQERFLTFTVEEINHIPYIGGN